MVEKQENCQENAINTFNLILKILKVYVRFKSQAKKHLETGIYETSQRMKLNKQILLI